MALRILQACTLLAYQDKILISRGSGCPRDDRHPVHHLLPDHLRVVGLEEEELEEDEAHEAAAQDQHQREAGQQPDGESLDCLDQ